MTKLFLIFFLTITLQICGQTLSKNTSKLIGKWLLKEHIFDSVKNSDDSLRIEIEFKKTGVFTTRYTYLYKNPKYLRKSTVTSGKWKTDSTHSQIRLYNIWEESPSPHQIPDKDIQIIEFSKKTIIVYEDLTPYSKGKSTYLRKK